MSKKKCLLIIFISIIIMSLCTNVFAADLTTKLTIVQKEGEVKALENEQGELSKNIVDSNETTGEVTIELKLSNKTKETKTNTQKGVQDSEIILVIDESGSMNAKVEGTKLTRSETVYNAANELVNKIFTNNKNVKMGVVKFAGDLDEESIADAQKMCDLTDNKDTVITALNTKPDVDVLTNLEAGILVAKSMYTKNNNNKIMIILTDGLPTGTVTKRNNISEINQITKATLVNTGNSGINIITMLSKVSNDEDVKEIFGTKDKPTVGKFYYIEDNAINSIITNDIYKSVTEIITKPNNAIDNVKIVDYFPGDITDNFDFSYPGKPSIGTVSDKIDATTKTITWDIGTLKGEETATLQYKLKIKDMKNSKILNKTIATNDKVVLTYTDVNKKDYTVTLANSPKIQLTEIKEAVVKETNTVKKDTTTIAGTIPKAGVDMTIVFAIGAAIITAVVLFKKLNKVKDVK